MIFFFSLSLLFFFNFSHTDLLPIRVCKINYYNIACWSSFLCTLAVNSTISIPFPAPGVLGGEDAVGLCPLAPLTPAGLTICISKHKRNAAKDVFLAYYIIRTVY